jgi:thiol-disulfide isomerase/thioredoxin
VLAAVQIAVLAVCNRIEQQRDFASLPVHMERRADPGHDLHVERWGGERVLVSARSGRYQLVHFWATWCPPCRKELPALMELASRKRDRIQVWAVSTDREWGAVQRFLDGDVPPGVVRDSNNEATRVYGVTGLPDSYLIDPDGRIRARFSGAQNWSSREMDRILDQLVPAS